MKPILLVFVCLLSLSVKSQIITTFAGNGTSSGVVGDGGPATNASINGATGGAFDKNGNYYVADILGHRVRKVTPSGIITTVAGTGVSGYNGDGIPATSALLSNPSAIAIDAVGNIYIDDVNNYRVRKIIYSTGVITTIAGTGVSGYNGDNISATSANLGGIQDICIDFIGNLYIADQVNFRVRKIDTAGVISTVAGNGTLSATGTGDGGSATNATFNWIAGLSIDNDGNLYIADMNSAKVRKVDTSGIISTIAGNGSFTYTVDGIPATNAQINPVRLTFDRAKNLVMADKYNSRILRIDDDGIIHTIAGNGSYTYTVDGIPATNAQINPLRITLDRSNNLVIADKYNRRILRIDDDGIIHTIAGNGISDYSGDGGPATAASFNFPAGVVYDTCGNLYIAESTNRRVRKVSFNPSCLPLGVQDMSINNVGEVLLYPNPTNSKVTVEGKSIRSVAVCNVLGQLVYEMAYKKADKLTVDISSLSPGIYMVRVNDVWVGKVVKE